MFKLLRLARRVSKKPSPPIHQCRRYACEPLERRLLLTTAASLSFAPQNGFIDPAMSPVDEALGDFNGDGNPDLAVLSGGSPPRLHIFINDGPGLFARSGPPRDLLLQINTIGAVTTGDFNGDGKTDVAVIGWYPNTAIKVMFGNGDGTLSPTIELPLGTSYWQDIVATDLNNDGRADLIVGGGVGTNGFAADARVFRGNPNNTFTEFSQPNLFGANADSLYTADVNKDGKNDILVRDHFGIVTVSLGLGNMAFQPALVYNPGDGGISDIAIADFNHDGKLDLAMPGGGLKVALGNGNGTFGTAATYAVGSVISGSRAAVGDFDGDGNLDLAFAGPGGPNGYFATVRGNGAGGFANGQQIFVASTIPAIVAADFSGDGKTDLALLTPDSHEVLSFLNVTKYPGYVHGIVFDDSNADHVASQFETRLSGWQVYLDPNDNDILDPGEPYALTDINGAYTLELLPGLYRLRVKVQLTYHQTTPASSSSKTTGQLVTVAERSVNNNFNFGVTRLGDIAGRVYYDTSADGINEDSDAGLKDWVVYVDANNNAARDPGELTALTDTTGHYLFPANFPARYTVRIEKPAGWKITAPVSPTGTGDGYWITQVIGGSSSTYTDFGVIHPGFVSGRVYDDRNANGGFDGADVGLAKWYVFVDINGNGTPDLGEPQSQSTANGLYTLTVPVAGTFAVKVIRPSGWQATQPAGEFYTVTFAPESTAPNRDFGSTQGPLNNAGFATAVNFTSVTNPDAIAVGDFNNDGKQDFAVANNGGQISIFLGGGNGTFAAPPGLPPGADGSPKGICAADFDGDNNLDLAVANTDSDDVSILFGNGDGTFDPAVNYAAAVGAFGVAAADFNGDSAPDLVVTGRFNDGIALLLNNGTGTFPAIPVTIPAGYGLTWVTVADVNNDSKNDLVSANSGSVVVNFGNGNGTFAAPLAYTSGVFSGFSVATGDFDGDTKLDIAVTNQFSDTVVVARGKGDGTFLPGTGYSVDVFPQQVVATDLDGDGKIDLAIACRNDGTANISGSVSILRGNGDGTFRNRLLSTTHTSPTALGVADFNSDSRPDIAVANFFSDDGSVLLNVAGAPTGSIAGSVFRDTNADGIRQPAESALVGWTVYLDADNSGTLDAGEQSAVSDFEGKYIFANVPVGSYVLREVVQPNFARIVPLAGYFPVTVAADSTTEGNDFGNIPTVVPALAAGGFGIRLDLAGNNIEVFQNALFSGAATFLLPASLATALSFVGGAGDDTLAIDLSRGNPFPAAGLSFAGGAGINRIQLLGTGAGDAVSSSATSLVVNGATAATFTNVGEIRSANLGTANVSVAAGSTLRISAADPIGSLSVVAGAHVVLTPGLGTLLLGALLMTPTASLDLADNTLDISYGSAPSPAALLSARIADGYNGGLWTGNGIFSSTAAAGHNGNAVGILDDGTHVLVKYTYAGDADLDGGVDFADLVKVAQNYNAAASGTWATGDFNYDQRIDFADLVAVAQNYNRSTLPAPAVSSTEPPAATVSSTKSDIVSRRLTSTVRVFNHNPIIPVRKPTPVAKAMRVFY